MTNASDADLKRLIRRWKTKSRMYLNSSRRTYKALGTGKLPQDDSIIYSVYEDSASGWTYLQCASDLETLLMFRGKK